MKKEEIVILIVEDELLIAESIAGVLKESGYSNTIIALNVEEAIMAISEERPQLVFTDIVFGSGQTGIDLGYLLKDKYKIPFIYITSHSSAQIVQRAKGTLPSAYLTKPFKKEDIFIALELTLFEEEIRKDNASNMLQVKDGHSVILVQADEIAWIKSDRNYTEIHLGNGKVMVSRASLTDTHSQLSQSDFIRIHKSYIVNRKHVKFIKSSQVQILEEMLPVGRSYRKEISKLM